MAEDNLSKFKEIISKLPEDERKLLYKRLRNMPADKREAYIDDFTKKYYIEKNKKEPNNTSGVQSIAVGLLAALVIVGFCYFIYIFNKANIDRKFNEMFGMPAEETVGTSPDGNTIIGPEPRHFPTDTPTPVPTAPVPTQVPVPVDHPDLTGLVIVIDPGHQAEYDYEQEEVGAGTDAYKDKGTPGAFGVSSGTKEFELTLKYAMVMKEYFEGCGAEVILTRDTNDVSLSNIDRAQIAIDNEADYFIRIHADSAPDEDIRGVKVYVPATGSYASNADTNGERLAEVVAEGIGSTSLGVVQSNSYTGLNHADSIKSYQLVVGYLSNFDDDLLLIQDDTPYKTAVAVAEFIVE